MDDAATIPYNPIFFGNLGHVGSARGLKFLVGVEALAYLRAARRQAGKRASRGALGEAVAHKLDLLSVAIAMAIFVLVPIVLNPDVLRVNPMEAYYPIKFKVLVGLSAALLVVLLGSVVLRGKPLVTPVLIPVLVFLGVSALSTFFSENPMHSLFGDRDEGLLSLAAGVLLFYAVARGLSSPVRVRVFLAAGVTAAVLISIYGISQNYGLDPISGWSLSWYTDIGRPFATLGNPITLASYLTIMAGAAMALCFGTGSRTLRVLWLLALAVIGVCWIYTGTRGAMLGVAAVLPVVLWAAHRRMGTARPLQAPLAVLILAVMAAIMASAAFGNLDLPPYVTTSLALYLILVGAVLWLSDLRPAMAGTLLAALVALTVAVAAVAVVAVSTNMSLLDRTTVDREGGLSSQVRLNIWRDTVPMILERPLLGHGPDNFAEPFRPHMGEELRSSITNNSGQVSRVDRAHNDLLQVAATTGLLGLAAYLWILVSYFRNAYRRGGWPLIALSGGVLAYIFQIQTSFPTASTNVAFWGLLGVSVAIMRLQDRESSEAAPEPTRAGSLGAALTHETPRAKAYELLAVAVVVAGLASIAVPTFLDQRAEAAKIARMGLGLDVSRTVRLYEQTKLLRGTYPEAGVYTRGDRITGGGMWVRPARIVTITTITSGDDFEVEGESTSLSGTFRYSYDSTTGEYSTPS
jgi:putative inorganic carbon (HCO3(-)) transporter